MPLQPRNVWPQVAARTEPVAPGPRPEAAAAPFSAPIPVPLPAPFSVPGLRSQAEAALLARAAPLMPGRSERLLDAGERALHELRVHQIELEMQNEELQRRQVELHAANLRYMDLYDLAPVGYCTLSESGQILQVNLTAATLLGVERNTLVTQPFTRFVFRDDMDSFYLLCRALQRTGEPQRAEIQLVRQGGAPFWAEIACNASPGVDGAPTLRLVLSDISEQKRAQEEQARTHAQYRLALEDQVKSRTRQFLDLYDKAPCGYHSLSMEGVITRVNKTGLALLGYTRQELVGQHIGGFMTPESARIFHASFERLLQTGSARNLDLDFICKDGAVRPCLMDSDVVADAGGEPALIHSTLVDMSERKLHAQRLELALMGADLGLWDLQISSGELHLSARAFALLGYQEGEMGPNISDFDQLVHPDDLPARRAAFSAIMKGDLPYYRTEYRMRHKEGHWVWVRSHGRIVARDEHKAPVRAAGTFQDISQERQLKQEGTDLLQRIELLIAGFGKLPEAPPPPVVGPPPSTIGAREMQVLQLIAAGCTSAEVGARLHISPATAATHRRNLMRKLDLHSTAELTRYALGLKGIPN